MAEIPQIESPTLKAIYVAYEAAEDKEQRGYLGMSTMGVECDRQLWYGFRWANVPEVLDGRKLRLFITGHREEARMIQDLKNAGLTIEEVNPETGEQFALAAEGGHFRGHMDGRAYGVLEAPKARHVVECKTHNEKSFKALLKDGIEKSKPGHFAQMQLYMHYDGTERALYIAHNKNTDELHLERVHYDAEKALRFVSRADRIVNAPRPPAKLHEDPSAKMAWQCNYCPARGICHDGQFARTHCRTCLHSTPVAGGWHCERHNRPLSIEDQKAGCASHLYIPDLVPGEQIDANEEAETVTYKLKNGDTWTDGPDTPKVREVPTVQS